MMSCQTCAKHLTDDCDNYDMKPIRWCYVATNEERDRIDGLSEDAEEARRDMRRKIE